MNADTSTHITLEGPADVLGLLPMLIGFPPEDALVLVHLDENHCVRAAGHTPLDRYPDGEADAEFLAREVRLVAANVNSPHAIAVMVCPRTDGRSGLPRAHTMTLVAAALEAAGSQVADVLHSDGTTWTSYRSGRSGPIDAASPAAVQAIVHSQLQTALPSFAAMRASVGPEPHRFPADESYDGYAARMVNRSTEELAARSLVLLDQLRADPAAGNELTVLIENVRIRDYMLWQVCASLGPLEVRTPDRALPEHVLDDLIALTRGTPDSRRAPLATVTGLLLYICRGAGHLGRTLVEDALAVRPEYSLATLAHTAMTSGFPPEECARILLTPSREVVLGIEPDMHTEHTGGEDA